jgi:hypothetical protein
MRSSESRFDFASDFCNKNHEEIQGVNFQSKVLINAKSPYPNVACGWDFSPSPMCAGMAW